MHDFYVLRSESPPEKTPCTRCFEFCADSTVWWAGWGGLQSAKLRDLKSKYCFCAHVHEIMKYLCHHCDIFGSKFRSLSSVAIEVREEGVVGSGPIKGFLKGKPAAQRPPPQRIPRLVLQSAPPKTKANHSPTAARSFCSLSAPVFRTRPENWLSGSLSSAFGVSVSPTRPASITTMRS